MRFLVDSLSLLTKPGVQLNIKRLESNLAPPKTQTEETNSIISESNLQEIKKVWIVTMLLHSSNSPIYRRKKWWNKWLQARFAESVFEISINKARLSKSISCCIYCTLNNNFLTQYKVQTIYNIHTNSLSKLNGKLFKDIFQKLSILRIHYRLLKKKRKIEFFNHIETWFRSEERFFPFQYDNQLENVIFRDL